MTVADVGVQDLKKMALRGGLAKLTSMAGNLALRFGFIIVAARLLEPEDFGLVAMVTVVTALLDQFATAGLSSAAVQKSTINKKQISTLFWINVLIGVALSLLCLLIAPLVVSLYHEPRLLWVTAAMGTSFLFNAAGAQHIALLQRQMRYATLATIEFSCQLISFCIGISLALAGCGYWALVAATVALPVTVTVSVWRATTWIPNRPSWNAEIGSMLHFGGTLTLIGLISCVTYNFDKFVLGRVWGASALGYYGTASQLINFPISNISRALFGVSFSTLSRLQHDIVQFRSYVLKGYSLYISMTLPVIIFSTVFAEDIILVVLGPKWTDAVDIFRSLAPGMLVFTIINPLGCLLISSGRHIRNLQISLVIAALVITGCLVGLPYGPMGVAIGFSVAMMLWLLPHVVWCLHGTTITPFDVLGATSRPLFSVIVAIALAYAARAYFSSLQTPVSQLGLACGVMMAAYACLMILVIGKDYYLNLVKAMRNTSFSLSEVKDGNV